MNSNENEKRDSRSALALALIVGSLMVGHACLEAARDALFLSKLPADALPWVYIALAILSFPVARAVARKPNRLSPLRLLSTALLVAGVITGVFVTLVQEPKPWVLYVFYIWIGLVATVTVPLFWLSASTYFEVASAKRYFTIIGAGAILGAVGGSLLALVLTSLAGPKVLVGAAAGILCLTGVLPLVILRPPPDYAKASPVARRRRQQVDTSSRRYLWSVGLFLATTSITLTGADLVFKGVVATNVESAQLGEFFAGFYAATNIAALFVQLVIAPRLLTRFGVTRSLGVLPVLIVVGTAGFSVASVFAAVLIFKAADGSLKHSLHRVSSEILFVPIPAKLRERAKLIYDAIPQRAGQATAAGAVLGAVTWGASLRVIAAGVAISGAVWLFALARVGTRYRDIFRATLKGTEIGSDLPVLDLDGLALVMENLTSPNDTEVVASMELLKSYGRGNLIPALILFHPSVRVVHRALDLLAIERPDVARVVARLAQHSDPDVRGAAISASARAGDDSLLAGAAKDTALAVRAAVAVAHRDQDDGAATVDSLRRGNAEEQVALVTALRAQRVLQTDLLFDLLRSDEPSVVKSAARSLHGSEDARAVHSLYPYLKNRAARAEVRAALLSIPGAFPILAAALLDSSTEEAVRRHLPRTLSRFADVRTLELLGEALRTTSGVTQYKILRGMGRIRSDHPTLTIDPAPLLEVGERALARAVQLLNWRVSLEGENRTADEAPRGAQLLTSLLREKERHCVGRFFRAHGIVSPKSHLKSVHDGLYSDQSRNRSASLELAESFFDNPTQKVLAGLTLNQSAIEKRDACGRLLSWTSLTRDEALLEMLADRSGGVRSVAAYHCAEISFLGAIPSLEKYQHHDVAFVSEAFQDALSSLQDSPIV